MADRLELKDESTTNPCCNEWKNRFLKWQQKLKKSEDGRAALKKAVGIYEQQITLMQNENLKLKKAYEDEKLQTEHARKDKDKEIAARVSLENEISTLKSDILSLNQKGNSVPEHVDKELKLLQEQLHKETSDRMKYMEAKKKADEEISKLKSQLLTIETEKKQIKQDLQKEKARADSEKKRAENALKTIKSDQTGSEVPKAGKENTETSLKSEDFLLPHKGHLGDTNLDLATSLKGQVSEMGTEISKLKDLLDKERRRADSETKKAESEIKKANTVKEMLKTEQSKADEQKKLADFERKKGAETAHQLERFKSEADEAKSKLVSENSKLKAANKKLEAERKKSNKEKKKAEEQQKIAELSTKNALEEKNRADRYHKELQECEQKYAKLKKQMEEKTADSVQVNKNSGQIKQNTNLEMEKESEQKKAAEMYKLQFMKEKSRADKLAQQLKDAKQKTKNENKDIQELVSARNITDSSSLDLIKKEMKAKSAEMKLLKKRIKFEKERVKHANQVANLEKSCKKAVEEELHRLKLEFAQFSNRVGLCSCFPNCNVGKSYVEKGNINSARKFMQTKDYPLHLQSGKEHVKPTCAVTKSFEYFKPSLDCPPPSSLPVSGTCTESTSGTAFKMEKPLLGGHSNRKNVDNSALVSSMSSFSDKQLVGPQGNSNLQLLPVSRLASEVNKTSNDAVVDDNNVKSPLRVKTKKRKRLANAVESMENLYGEGETLHAKVAKKVSDLPGGLDKPLIHDEDQDHKKIEQNEDVDLTDFENNIFDENDVEVLKRMLADDCMNLLNLDSVVDEERYRAAVERPLSPNLPNIYIENNQLNVVDYYGPSEVNESLPGVTSCMVPCGTLGGNESGSGYVDDSQYLVIFPEIMEDSSCLSKIFHATRTSTSQCSEFSQSDHVVKNIASALSADEILSSKEKVCVFFSLFLKSFSDVAMTNLNSVVNDNFLNNVDFFSGLLRKVMSEVEIRTFFSEVCNLDELITLIHDFIINERMLSHSSFSSSFHKPSFHQLVLGAVLLASICAAFDRVESICETSYNISHITTSSSNLTVLHIFMYICGEKLLANDDYSLIMTVISSLVTDCERENLSLGFPSCARCPFSDGSVSMEEITSILLKRLWSMHESTTVPDGSLSNLGDVLSLLELLTSKMSWGWVCNNIISQLLKLLEDCVMETPLTAIFTLLGKIARVGIDANGFEDDNVEKIRVSLSSFITSTKISLPIQFAAVNALLCTTTLSFQEVCKNSLEMVPPVSPSTPKDCIHKWFSLLSDEQKSLSVGFFTA